MLLDIRDPAECRYDIASLGEVMLRLDPGETRIRSARSFAVWEGGGEYNVARGLSRVFKQRAAVVTALVDNEVGTLLESLILGGGVDTQWISWHPYDGIGSAARNGLNFTERGFGVRGALGVSDRGHSAASRMLVNEVDWNRLFGELGVRWFHTGGIYAGLSPSTAQVTLEAVKAAKEHGTIVSYDLNFRPSLWRVSGNQKARDVNQSIAPYVDVMLGNEEDFTEGLGFEVEGAAANYKTIEVAPYGRMINRIVEVYPNLKVVATTLRAVRTATLNDWSAVGWSEGTGLVRSAPLRDLEIFDRVGGGDSFASGLIYGLLSNLGLEQAVAYGVAHGALAMTTPGDTSMASLGEVVKLVSGGGSRVER